MKGIHKQIHKLTTIALSHSENINGHTNISKWIYHLKTEEQKVILSLSTQWD